MTKSNYKPALFGVRCDAITKKGKRCKRLNRWEIPCAAVHDARVTSYRAEEFKPVRLCSCHHNVEYTLRKQGKRLKLHHGGWLGAFNKHQFGNLVIASKTINWDTIKSLKVPIFWRNENPLTS